MFSLLSLEKVNDYISLINVKTTNNKYYFFDLNNTKNDPYIRLLLLKFANIPPQYEHLCIHEMLILIYQNELPM